MVNRSDGTMELSWRDPELLPRVAIALTVGQSAAKVALPCHQKPLLTKQLWFAHNIANRGIAVNKPIRFGRQKPPYRQSYQYREGKAFNSLS